MAAKKTKTRKTKKQPTALGFLFKWAFVLGLWALILSGSLIAWYASELPEITRKVSFERKSAITIQANDGSTITRYGEIKGQSVRVEDLPPHLMNAVIAIEDRRFYYHPGMDPLGLIRAVVTNVQKGRLAQGGSTITQQLAKNLFLSHERTFKRKIQEAMLALWLERELTKDEILSAYLNRVYLGSGAYGVDAAAKLYFGKPAKEMSLQECATIAGLLKAPSRYSPLNNPDLSRKRAQTVLSAMIEAGYITEEDSAQNAALSFQSVAAQPTGLSASRYYTDWIVDGLKDLIGTPEADLIVETTLSPVIQSAAEEALTRALTSAGEDANISQGAALVMRPDGAVMAMVGGANYRASQFNRAVQAKRQPGSAFKPVLYLTALEQGWKTDSTIMDEPFDEDSSYRPQNFADKYYGEVTLEQALAKSMNTAAVRLMMETGRRPVIETAKNLGIHSPLRADLSLALGSSGVSLIEMTTAYAALANGGLGVFPYAITKITDTDGNVYYERPSRTTTRRVAKKSSVQDLTGMLQTAVNEGTGRAARLDSPAAGKTGTSQDSRDAWFIGYTDELIAGVWLGNDDNAPMNGITGGGAPARIWKDIMENSLSAARNGPRYSINSGGFQSLIDNLLGGGNSGGDSTSGRPRYNQ